jgi:FHS family L-fucose permease-like MFS transporter
MTNVSSPSVSGKNDGSSDAIYIIGALFFIFGFVTWMNSVLIPYLKLACELNNFESYLVAFSFYISYLVMAIPSAWLLKKTGFKNGMSVGLGIMALGCFNIYTRCNSPYLRALFTWPVCAGYRFGCATNSI